MKDILKISKKRTCIIALAALYSDVRQSTEHGPSVFCFSRGWQWAELRVFFGRVAIVLIKERPITSLFHLGSLQISVDC